MLQQLLIVGRNALRTAIRDERGATLAEYLLITILIVAVGFVIFRGMKGDLNALGNDARKALTGQAPGIQ